jgi:two-component SAPR family response regulator
MAISKPLERKSAAILDDIEKWRNIARDNLTFYGCIDISYFESKSDIVDAYGSEKVIAPDMAFLDINLDIVDVWNREGLEVCQFFRNTHPKTTIVLMSSLEEIAKESRKVGPDFIIRKKCFKDDFDTFIKHYAQK